MTYDQFIKIINDHNLVIALEKRVTGWKPYKDTEISYRQIKMHRTQGVVYLKLYVCDWDFSCMDMSLRTQTGDNKPVSTALKFLESTKDIFQA